MKRVASREALSVDTMVANWAASMALNSGVDLVASMVQLRAERSAVCLVERKVVLMDVRWVDLSDGMTVAR